MTKGKLKELTAYRLQKRCDEQAVFVVEGPKLATEALASGFRILALCATAQWLQATSPNLPESEVYEVSPSELARLSSMKSPNQVWMLLERSTSQPSSCTSSPLILALDRLQDPGNLGTIMRTADWYGLRRIVCSHDTANCFSPKVVQASMGAIFRTSVEYVDLPKWLSSCGMPIYGASLQGQPVYELPKLQETSVLLIGNEGRGISPEVMACVSTPVCIPNFGRTAESLNASVATAILIDRLWNN